MFDILEGDNLPLLKDQPDRRFRLVYIDPPFNTGNTQSGRGGAYEDDFEDLPSVLEPRLIEARRVLTEDGSLFVHLDPREVHYVKVLLDRLFGRKSFINEIIWAYDYGGRPRNRWPAKHDNILWYAKNPDNYVFNYDEIDRIPYMAPALAGAEKAERGKTPTDVWWQTIVPTMSDERKRGGGYPTQKPLGILNRIIRVHSNPGDWILDFFAGSGTTGESALLHDRHCVLMDQNPQAVEVMRKRLARFSAPSTLNLFQE